MIDDFSKLRYAVVSAPGCVFVLVADDAALPVQGHAVIAEGTHDAMEAACRLLQPERTWPVEPALDAAEYRRSWERAAGRAERAERKLADLRAWRASRESDLSPRQRAAIDAIVGESESDG